MYSECIEVKNKSGLHARPAAVFVQTAARYKSAISIEKDTKKANAKSIMSLLSIGVSKGSNIRITADGEDEKQAVEALIALISSGFGEE